MKIKFPILKLLLLAVFSCLVNINKAQNPEDIRASHLFIKCLDNEIYEIKLSSEFNIDKQGERLDITWDSGKLDLPVSSISSLGFIYMDDDMGIGSIIDKDRGIILIYDMEGRLIRETNTDSPDLSGLSAGKVYIIKNGSSSVKYMPIK